MVSSKTIATNKTLLGMLASYKQSNSSFMRISDGIKGNKFGFRYKPTTMSNKLIYTRQLARLLLALGTLKASDTQSRRKYLIYLPGQWLVVYACSDGVQFQVTKLLKLMAESWLELKRIQ